MNFRRNAAKLLFLIIVLCNHLQAQSYEIRSDSLNASGWFGGDDRQGQQRNVAIAQSVLIEKQITLETFSFYFTSPFDSVNGLLTGYEVTLKLHIRDSIGAILHSELFVVPDTFSSGWVTWSDIGFHISEAGKYIFSAYLIGGYDSIMVHSGIGSDLNANYLNGEMYVKYVGNDNEAETWGDWSLHSWDANFWLTGSIIPTSIENDQVTLNQFTLNQNYPNPFNPTTNFEFRIADFGFVSLKVFDVLGREVKTLVNEVKQPGIYKIKFDAAILPSGTYFYQLKAGDFSETKKLMLMK